MALWFLLLWMIYLTKMGEAAQNRPWISLTEGTAAPQPRPPRPCCHSACPEFIGEGNPAALSADVVRNLLFRSLLFAPACELPRGYITGVGRTEASKTAVSI